MPAATSTSMPITTTIPPAEAVFGDITDVDPALAVIELFCELTLGVIVIICELTLESIVLSCELTLELLVLAFELVLELLVLAFDLVLELLVLAFELVLELLVLAFELVLELLMLAFELVLELLEFVRDDVIGLLTTVFLDTTAEDELSSSSSDAVRSVVVMITGFTDETESLSTSCTVSLWVSESVSISEIGSELAGSSDELFSGSDELTGSETSRSV